VLSLLLLSLSLVPLWEEAMLADEGRRGVDSVLSGGIVMSWDVWEWNKGIETMELGGVMTGARVKRRWLVSADFDPCGLIGSMQARSPGNLARTILLSKSLLGGPCTILLCRQTFADEDFVHCQYIRGGLFVHRRCLIHAERQAKSTSLVSQN
jgi:hypothetical protein